MQPDNRKTKANDVFSRSQEYTVRRMESRHTCAFLFANETALFCGLLSLVRNGFHLCLERLLIPKVVVADHLEVVVQLIH